MTHKAHSMNVNLLRNNYGSSHQLSMTYPLRSTLRLHLLIQGMRPHHQRALWLHHFMSKNVRIQTLQDHRHKMQFQPLYLCLTHRRPDDHDQGHQVLLNLALNLWFLLLMDYNLR